MIKVNIGCGNTDFGSDWINIDGKKLPHIKYNNIVNLPFAANSVDLLYSSHVLEYFDREELIFVLREWYRVLKVGGIIRLAVPDFNVLAKIVLDGNNLENILGPLYGRMSMGEEAIYHKTCYNYNSLKRVLQHYGFKNVKKWNWKKISPNDKIDDCCRAHWPHRPINIQSGKFDKDQILISLNIQATK